MCGIQTRWKQDFYDEVEPIKLRDPLAEMLGAVEEGEELVFTYADAVKLAGHSCPAVSGAYKATQKALEELYPNQAPLRGEISVRVLGSIDHAANGPVSQVISLITGAAHVSGFSGIGGKFVRKNKLVFETAKEEPNTFIFTRDDNGKSVKISYHPELIPQEPKMQTLLTKCTVGTATDKQKQDFILMWQNRVRVVLFEEVKGLFAVKRLN